MRPIHLVSAVAILHGLFGIRAAHAQLAPQKTLTLGNERVVGYYTVLPADGPVLKTFREHEESAARNDKPATPQARELRGPICYPSNSSIGIILTESGGGTVTENLKALVPLDASDVTSILVATKLQREALSDLQRFKSLRQLSVVLDPDISANDLGMCIAEFSSLRYLSVYMANNCQFGTAQFCEIISSLQSLKYLSIPCEKLTDTDVEILARNSGIEQIHLRSRRPVLGAKSLAALRNMPRLRELWIVCTNTITDSDIMSFAEQKNLQALDVVTSAHLTCSELFKQRRPDCWFFINEPSDDIR